MQVKIVVPVWGMDYIETFIKISLATQLSENNLPLISQKFKVEYVIYTLKSNKLYLKNSESIKFLAKFASIRIETINKLKTRDTYRIYGQIHHRELKSSSKLNECVFLINADFVFSDGFFDQTLNEIKNGKKVVNIVCPRANLEPVKSLLLSRFSKSREIIQIQPKNLTSIFLRNIHKMMNYHMLPKSDGDAFLPTSLMWKAKNGSLYIRNFHFHPVLIYPYLKKVKKIRFTIDDGYVLDNFDRNEIFYQKNSNNYCAIELSNESLTYKPTGAYGSHKSIFYYFLRQNKSNFINYNEEVVMGKISRGEIIKFKMLSEKEIKRLMSHFLDESHKFEIMQFKAVFIVYGRLASYIVRIKRYIPNFILVKLENIHKIIKRKFFRVQILELNRF